MKIIIVLSCLLALAVPVQAAYETPKYQAGFIYEPFGQDAATRGLLGVAVVTIGGNGYVVTSYAQSSASIDPSVTIERDLVNALTGEYGVRLVLTHGDANGFAAEVYPPTTAGFDSAVSHRQAYIRRQLFTAGELYIGQPENGSGWAIYATSGLISRLSRMNTNAIAFIAACYSSGYLGSFKCRWAAGLIGQTTSAFDVDTFWGKMAGQAGMSNRSCAQAISGLSSFGTSGNGETVLAPAMSNRSHPDGSLIDGRTSLWIEFDTVMDTSNHPALGSLVIAVFRATYHWNGAIRFEFDVTGVDVGAGFVRVPYELARSAGGIGLHGQADQFLNFYSIRADNGAAAVHSLRVRDGQLTFQTDGEWNTSRYLVDTAPSPDGPFTEVASIPATGSPAYAMPVPSALTYRLREEEISGRTFPLGLVEPTAPDTRPPDPTYDQAYYLAQIQTLLQQHQIAGPGPPLTPFAVFAESAFHPTLQYLLDFWRTKGYAGSLEATDGWPTDPDQFLATAETVMRGYWQQGVRLFQIVGTSSDYRQFFDEYQNWYTTPDWLAIRSTQIASGLQRQPERDVFPTFYVPDPAPRGQNIGYWRPFVDTDAPLADLDDDGLPDVVLARLPVANEDELAAAVYYLLYDAVMGPASPQIGILGYDWDAFGNSGALVRQDCDSLASAIPAERRGPALFASEVPSGSYISGRTAAFNGLVSGGIGTLFIESPVSNRYRPGDWVDLEEGFRFSDNTSGRRYFLVGATCEVAGSNRSLHPSIGLPWVEQGLTSAGGPCAVAGFNTGSLQGGNGLLAIEIARRITTPSNYPLAEDCLYALWSFLDQYPAWSDLARTFSFQGWVLTDQTIVPIPTDGLATPFRTVLEPAWPNPANPTTTLRYGLASAGPVSLTVYGVDGRTVRRLLRDVAGPGSYQTVWDGTDDRGQTVASGVYVVRLSASTVGQSQKIVLVR